MFFSARYFKWIPVEDSINDIMIREAVQSGQILGMCYLHREKS